MLCAYSKREEKYTSAEGEVLLAEEGDDDRKDSDDHLTGGGIPAEDIDTKLEAEVVDKQIDKHDKDIAQKLRAAGQRRLGKRDVLIEPKAGEKRNREHYTERGDVG